MCLSEAEVAESSFVTINDNDNEGYSDSQRTLVIDEFPQAFILPVKHPPSLVVENEDLTDQDEDGVPDLAVLPDSHTVDGTKSNSPLFVELVKDSTIIIPDKGPKKVLALLLSMKIYRSMTSPPWIHLTGAGLW